MKFPQRRLLSILFLALTAFVPAECRPSQERVLWSTGTRAGARHQGWTKVDYRSWGCKEQAHARTLNNVGKMRMSILPISQNKVYDLNLVSREVNAAQWSSYWGLNSKERLQRVLESLLVAYGGAWFAWFVSFMAGGLAPFVGTFLVFNWLYSPWLNAKRRNDKFWSTREFAKKYAIYCGQITNVNKLKRRAGKTIGAAKQEFLQLLIEDENGRELEIITQWQEKYRRLQEGALCETILVSSSGDFTTLSLVTDVWVPSCDVWCGDYPYINKLAFQRFMKTLDYIPDRKIIERATVTTGDDSVRKSSRNRLDANADRNYKRANSTNSVR